MSTTSLADSPVTVLELQRQSSHSDHAMVLSREALRVHARYIRDVLGPLVAREGGDVLNPTTTTGLLTFFEHLNETVMTLDMIQYSRIEKAIMDMCGPGTRWPAGLIKLAEDTIDRWEGYLGPLRRVRANLWGPGGRLEGVTKVPVQPERVREDDPSQGPQLMARPKERKSSWFVESGCDPTRAYVVGDNGFKVGA